MPTTTIGRSAAVLTTLAALVVGGTAGTAAAATPTHTSLSIRVAKTTIDPGAHDTVSTVLLAAGHALAGATVVLEARPQGASGFHDVATTTTGQHGGAAFAVQPEHRTAYEIVFRGSNGYAPSHSGVVTVGVRPDTRRASSLSIRASRSAVDPTQTVVISGVLRSGRSALGDRDVVLAAKPAGTDTWKSLRSKRTGRHGFVAFTVRPAQKTRYMLVFRPTTNFRGTHSGVVTVNVRTPVSLAVTAASTSVEAGAADTINGLLKTAAGPLANRTITLLALPAGSKTWSKLATGTTANDGTVSFPVTVAKTTRYALLSARSYDFTAARNGVTVYVRKATSLSIRLSGDSKTVAGTLLGQGGSALAGRTVTLESKPAGTDTFTPVASATTNRSGYVAFQVSPSSTTDYELVFGGGSRYDGCHSGVVTVTVA